jgi:hypothetical protein
MGFGLSLLLFLAFKRMPSSKVGIARDSLYLTPNLLAPTRLSAHELAKPTWRERGRSGAM